MKKVLTICTLLVALTCMIVYAGNGITVVDRGKMESKKAVTTTTVEVTKAKKVEAPVAVVDEAKLLEQQMIEAAKAAEVSIDDLQNQLKAAKARSDKNAMIELETLIGDAIRKAGRSGSGTLDACDDCLTPNTDLGVIGTAEWGYTVNGDMTSEGKWYASFTGEAGMTYWWDLCDQGTASADVDIKISDASCTILVSHDGPDACDYHPDDYSWACPANGTYYVEVCDYASPISQHQCDELSTTTFTLAYYKAEPIACAPTQPDQTDAFVFTPTTAYENNLYDDTGCLNYYDDGNDDIILWHVTNGGGWYELHLTADDNYPGIAVTNDCEATDCIVWATGGSAYEVTTECTWFDEGDYYIFVSNYSETPTTFTMTVSACSAPPVGRCCYGDQFAPTCDDMTEADCEALTDDISWDELMNCHDNPCEPAVAGRCCYGSDPFVPSCEIETESDCLARGNDISWTEGVTDCELEPCPIPVCDEPVGPMGDECADAVDVGTLPAHMVGDITGMTVISSPVSCGYGSGPAVWYSVVGTGNTLTASTCDVCTGFDSYVRIYACDCDNPICVDYEDGGCAYNADYQSRATVSWCTEIGEVYLIAVHGYYSYSVGMFVLDVTDDGVACEDAIVCPETGACCYHDGADCADVTEAECDAMAGVYYPGVLCSEMTCPTPCPFENLDIEPNDQCENAQDVICDASYCGEHSTSSDYDFYRLVVAEENCVSLTINVYGDDTPGMWPYGQGLDAKVYVYGPDDCTNQIGYSDDEGVGLDSYLETECLEAGIYWIKVGGYSAVGPYVLDIACTSCSCPTQFDCNDFVLCGTPVETEPNDDCATSPDATVLECGSVMYGVICEFDEHDVYQIAVPAMTSVSVSIFDGEGCAATPTECVLSDLIAADCEYVYGTGNTGGWTLTNDADAAGYVYLDVYGTTDMCVSTYMIEVTCCDIINPCSAEGLIPVEVVNGSYTYYGNTCCYTGLVPCVYAADCAGSCYTAGPSAIFMLQIVETSLIDQILLTMEGDCQMMIFTDCADPEGTCVASQDALTGGNEEFLNLTLDPGIYFLSVSRYSSEGTACGPFQVDILSDFSLPVELTSFDAIAGDRSVTLNWATASENNNERFDVFANGELRGRVDAKNLSIGGEYSFTDEGLTNGTTYDYSVASVSMNGEIEELFTISATPSFGAATISEYALHQNFPNPFNPETKITFDMVDAGFVNLSVYNLLGQKVATLVNSSMDAGRHIVSFQANSLPSGLYLYRMETDGFTAQKKMILMK